MNQFPINAMPVRAWPVGAYVGSTGGVASEGVIIWRDRGYVAGSEARVFVSGNDEFTASLTNSARAPKLGDVPVPISSESVAVSPDFSGAVDVVSREASPRLVVNESEPKLS